jgi:hypothetical protein
MTKLWAVASSLALTPCQRWMNAATELFLSMLAMIEAARPAPAGTVVFGSSSAPVSQDGRDFGKGIDCMLPG